MWTFLWDTEWTQDEVILSSLHGKISFWATPPKKIKTVWNKVEMEVPPVKSALSTRQRREKISAHKEWLSLWNNCRVPKVGIHEDVHSSSVIKLFLSRSKWISTNLLSYSSVSSWIPSTIKIYTVQLANPHRLCSSFMHARHISCCEQPIRRELFELVYCCSQSVLHCPISSFLARQRTPAACYRRRRRDDEALCPAGMLDISDVQISLPTTNWPVVLIWSYLEAPSDQLAVCRDRRQKRE